MWYQVKILCYDKLITRWYTAVVGFYIHAYFQRCFLVLDNIQLMSHTSTNTNPKRNSTMRIVIVKPTMPIPSAPSPLSKVFIVGPLSLSLLGEEKYGTGSEPQWKAGGTRYPNLYKALLEEPSRTRRTKLLEDIPRGKIGDGRNTRRPARARIRNQ